MATGNVSVRISVQDADQASAALAKLGADGAASLQKLGAASDQLSAQFGKLNESMNQTQGASDNAGNQTKELGGHLLDTVDHALNLTNHLKLLALAAYAMSPAFRAVANSGISVALGAIPPVATTAAASLLRFAGPALSFFGRLTLPIGAAVAAWKGLNYVIDQGSTLVDKYGDAERKLYAPNVDSDLTKLGRFQTDTISQQQVQYATELASRLAEAKKNIKDFMDVQIDVTDPALRLQGIWVGIVSLIGKAADSLNHMSAPDDSGFQSLFASFNSWSKSHGLWVEGGLPGAVFGPSGQQLGKGDRDDTEDRAAMRLARGRLAAGMGGEFVGRFSGEVTDLANPPKHDETNKNATDAYQRSIQGIKDQIEVLKLEADGAGKTSEAIDEMKTAHTANLAAMKAGIPVTDQMRAKWKELGDQIADYTIKVNQAKSAQSAQFSRDTMFLSGPDAAAANAAHQIDPNNWQAHINDAGPAMDKFNAQLSEARDLSTQFATGFTQAMLSGKNSAATLRTEINSLIGSLAQMATKSLVNSVFGSLFAGGGASALAPTTSSSVLQIGALFADGGIMTSMGALPLNRYASGGVASGPQVAMFGEGRGPEAYVPLPDGRSIPVALQGGGGGGNVINSNMTLHVNVPQGTSVEDSHKMAQNFARQARDMVRQAVHEELITHTRVGGLLNPA